MNWDTVETAKFGSHFCSDFSTKLCSFRSLKILLSSDDMDKLLSSDHMNELCNYELKSSDICSELLSCQNQWGNDEVKALMQGHTSSACYLTVQRMCSPDVNTLLNVWNSHCSASLFNVSETFLQFGCFGCFGLLINCKIRPQNKTDVRPKNYCKVRPFWPKYYEKTAKFDPNIRPNFAVSEL